MFCDLRGITAEELTLHINSVHCSDNSEGDASYSGMQQHLNGAHWDAENQSTSETRIAQLPVLSGGMEHLATGGIESCQTDIPGNASQIYRNVQEKRKLSDNMTASNSCPEQETMDLLSACVSSYSDDDLFSNRSTLSLSQNLPSAAQSLQKTTAGNCIDQSFPQERFVSSTLCSKNAHLFYFAVVFTNIDQSL